MLNIVGYLTSIIFLITLGRGIFLWAKGILPVILKLGNGLVKAKIAIFATGNELDNFRDLLLKSDLFSPTNIIDITSYGEIGLAKDTSLYLVDWDNWQSDFNDILSQRGEKGKPIVIYAPPRTIPPEKMNELSVEQNLTVTNFRGRLLNDVMISLITGSYNK
jgi:hypothetical protein